MAFLITLAWRNLSRYRRRTLITASALSFGLALFIVSDSLLKGAERDSERNLILYETGSAQIFTWDYWEKRELLPLDRSIPRPERVYEILDSMGILFAPRVSFAAELILYRDPYPEDGSVQVRVTAIDPRMEIRVSRLSESVSKGEFLRPGEPGLLMGAWLAEKLGADVGYPVTLKTRTKEGFYQVIDLTITGILNTPNPIVNRYGIYIPLDVADSVLQMGGEVTSIALLTPMEEGMARRVEHELLKAGIPLKVATWREMAKGYVALARSKQQGSKLILLLVFIIAAIGISNTMLMAVLERRREIGMMRALGMSEGEIGILFLLESAGIGVIGAIAGIALGAIANFFLVRYGIDYSFLIRGFDVGYRVAGVFRGIWSVSTFVQALILGPLLSVFVSVFPVRRALKRSVVECLRAS